MMDPSHSGIGPSKESCNQSSAYGPRDAPPPPVAPPYPAYYPPPPPGMGYPGPGPGQGHIPPHQGYPPGYGPYPAQTQGYYYSYYNGPQPYRNGNGGKAFVRGFVLCSCIIFTGFFVATIVMALLLHPQLPIFSVNSLAVANFNTTSILTADWNTSITFENVNEKLKGLFSNVKVEIVHKNDILAETDLPDFDLDKKEHAQMNAKARSNESLPKWDLDAMASEQASGTVMLSLRLSSMITFRSSSMSTRNALIIAVCDKLKVVFQNNTGSGTLDNGGRPINCQLYI